MENIRTKMSLRGAEPAMNGNVFIGEKNAMVKEASVLPTAPYSSSATDAAAGGTAAAAAAAVAGGDDTVRLVTVAEYKQAALCLAEAFADDDVARYFTHTPDREHWTEAQRWKLHVEIMEYITYAHILKGLVLAVGPDYGCVALWLPPGQNMDDYLTIFRSGMWRLNYKLSREGKTRLFEEFFPLLHDTKHEIMGKRDDDSWYLVYIGTKAAARGKGYARKLIEYVTANADAKGKACYLESSNAINPFIYRKLGFEVVKTIGLSRTAAKVELDIMVREPAARKITSPPPVLEKVDSMFAENVAQLSVAMKIGNEKMARANVALA